MSHYVVAVFTTDDGQSVDDLLAPYEEKTGNPNSKWDWYEIGGRWKNELLLKDKTQCDVALVSDIDFEAMRKRDAAELDMYEDAMQNSLMKEEYMRKRFRNEEEYIKLCTTFATFAVVTPDGKWHAEGEMGMFGLSFATPEEERAWTHSYHEQFIKPALENGWRMTIVDCHI